ncbi:TetR/AcrR family transcriptional regulator C-terminal domain-containing protein [Niallia taxi]|uniref:TetR/AcrR family transcriptional regulator C-terminal domain-containing protein n=1 Tax=Niallia taxi TaxID=2499688 RepID=UPI0011A71BC0|nr:TetR/AcrR family transcriptional regulator C-terminal domain-containing protein [Niallia taxi]MCT2346315.1 TetR/AcrR family transcriptional regulator C-terminal domain-containing protein [Niallia taxi]MDE5051671.1 TetR/AcrR family transcriptional regulator C-terminal domain-containing protein [Niallia taxi]MED3964942.1 TetR/AcrR family transcriptional regulator C-terminal domain-containing protein [Niallia taxi]WOD61906.1 TetR/AcrR family transcriptional regulator C-terminal domain-containin
MKKQQPQISEDKILATSWELLGEDGIEKLSMRKLANRLGIQAPSLYWYFKSKQNLYQRLANTVSKVILEEFHSDGDWKEQLTELAITTRSVLSRYPCSTQLMMMTLPHEPDIIRFTNTMLLCVESTPLEQEQKMQVVTTLVNYVFYFVLDDYQHERNVSAMLKEQETLPGDELIRLLDTMSEQDAGLFKRMFTGGLFEMMGTDAAFDFGLKVIILGIEQVIMEQNK